MTITVQSGITIARLAEILSAEGQRLPIDVPQAERATLGGAIAVNASGPRRYRYGTFRDYILGISVVNDRGEEVKAGGRVVKNVAGYDLCKLHIGALGTLGIITQITLKLRPLAEETALVILGCPDDGLAALLDAVHGSPTQPVCVELLNQAAAASLCRENGAGIADADWVLVVGYEGSREAVTWQVQQLVREQAARCPLEARVGTAGRALWQALVELPGRASDSVTFKANLLPSACAEFCRQAHRIHDGLLLQAHAGNGIIIGHAPPGLNEEQVASLVARLRRLASAGSGQVVLPRCPVEWKERLGVWGPAREGTWLMRQVKEQLDPGRIFNPGRFVDGI
jgi:glycolate oxidase FAD binding subunit